jgi:tyrosyl-tRNA synthetase
LDFEGDSPAKLLDNRAWTVGIGILDFLRDIGKHVTVNQMIAKDSVKSRMSEGDGISYTEFSYMMLQGYDYLWLADNENCQLQVGGSDQWGNIVLGVDLIRRKLGQSAHALTWPLLTKPDGSKYGKTAGGETIWLSPNRMSPYRFYQAWISVDDSEVRKLLLQLTFLSVEDVEALVLEHEAKPQLRLGQRTLASELTGIVHGESAAASAAEASAVLFDPDIDVKAVSEAALEFVSGEVPSTALRELGSGIIDLLVESGLCQSRKDAKRSINEGGIYLNGERVGEADFVPSSSELLHDKYVLLRRGKKLWHLLIVG